jgi:hypothetical protein
MKLRNLYLSSVFVVLAVSGTAAGASIDSYEPVTSGTAVPTSAERFVKTGAAWVAYSDGGVYFTSNADSSTPNWSRMDKGSNMGQPFDMGFGKPITHGNITWTDLSPASISDIEGISVNPLNVTRVYAATSSGAYYSADSGNTWQTTSYGDPLVPPSGAAVSAIGASGLSRGDWIVVGAANGELDAS